MGAACASRAALARGVRGGWLHGHPLLDLHAHEQHVPVFGGVRVDVYGASFADP